MTNSNRTALVTGANRGIGLAIASGLAEQGIRVLAAARRADDAGQAVETIGHGAIPVAIDLSDAHAAAAAAAAINEQHGPIDILVNNAGVLDRRGAIEIDVAGLEDSLTINTVAPFALIRTLGPGMAERGWGRIVNVTSGWGSFGEGLEGPLAYAVSKAALNAVTVSAAAALGPAIKVNALCPGWVRTRMGGDEAERTPEQGADTPIWLATLPDDGPSGGFFRDRKPIAW